MHCYGIHFTLLLLELYEPLQSAYKKFHSTGTTPIKVHNDIVTAIDSGHSVILVLLDLSAAFDTVDHRILIRRLSTRCNRMLDWFVWYLSDRTQYVKVKDTLLFKRPRGERTHPPYMGLFQ